MPACMMYIKDE